MATGVLADANVLFSKTLRDWLFLLRNESGGNMFVVYSTVDIMAEVAYHLRRANPAADGASIARTHDLIVDQIDDRIDDFKIDGSYPGADPDDQHVHAAAMASGADIVVTSDAGFTGLSEEQQSELACDICTPDEFFVLVDDSAPDVVERVTNLQRDCWAGKPRARSLADQLAACDCPDFAARVSAHLRVTR